MVSVIIACGGSSSRMGGINKLLMKLGEMTVLERTISAFCEIDSVGEIILACSEEFKRDFQKIKRAEFSKPIVFAQNGETRQKSVANGFYSCNENADLVCIHDGARPLILRKTIEKAISDAEKFGSSVVCVPCKDTVKLADESGNVMQTPPRDRLFSTQTPQIFLKEEYKTALAYAEENGFDFTDDSQLFEAIGKRPHITAGDYSNIKITTVEDIALAEQYLSQNR